MAKQEIGTSPILDPETPVAPPEPAPEWDANGRLTYASMQSAVRSGRSVMYKGRIISQAANLPTELEYAQSVGDKSAVQQAAAAQEKRIADLQAELDRMKAAAGNGPSRQPQGQGGGEEPVIAGRPLSAYDGKSDQELDAMEGVGPATVKEIRAAQKERDRTRVNR